MPDDAVPLRVVGSGSEGVTASYFDASIFVAAPASSGCDWSASLDDTNEYDRLVNITLVRRTAEVCGAELYEQVFEFTTDVDLSDDFTVQVHVG